MQLAATLRAKADFTPISFQAKGKSYRFVNVDSDVRVEGSDAVVRADGASRARVTLPAQFFTVDGYAPFSAQMLLLRYWKQHGQPRLLRTVPGQPTNDVFIEARGREAIRIGEQGDHARALRDRRRRLGPRNAVARRTRIAGGGDHARRRPQLRGGARGPRAGARAVRPARRRAIGLAISNRSRGSNAPLKSGDLRDGGRDDRRRHESSARARRRRASSATAASPTSARAPPCPIPDGVPTVDVSGKTLVPGLWDMHTHVTQIEWAPVYLASGVTTVRDMGNEFEFITPLRDAIASKRALGPRLLLAGLVDGPRAERVRRLLCRDARRSEAGRSAKYHDAGFQQIKIYSLITPPLVEAICAEAHRLGMTVTGHVPNGMTIDQAATAGMDQIAHLAFAARPGRTR